MLVFPTIKISENTPFKRGESYGSQAALLISVAVETYKTRYARAGIDWEIARAVSMKHLDWAETNEGLIEEVEELRGIAAGSGMDVGEIAALNTRYELLHFPKECTSFALSREATAEGHVIVGQNWDQDPVLGAHAVLLDITEEEKGNHIFGVSEAGQLIRSGMCIHEDGSGTAACKNSILSNLDRVGIGLPGCILMRKILTMNRINSALNLIESSARSVSSSITMGTTENKICSMELLPQGGDKENRLLIDSFSIIQPTGGTVTHDNSIRTVPGIDMYRHGHPRGTHLKILFSERTGRIDLDYIKKCLSDHEGYPGSICSHGNDEDENWQTISSAIYDLDGKKAYISCGAPCQSSYMEFDV